MCWGTHRLKIAKVKTTKAVLGWQLPKLVSVRDVKRKTTENRSLVPKVQNFSPKKLHRFFTWPSSVSKIYQCAFQISSLKSYPNLVPPVYVSLGFVFKFSWNGSVSSCNFVSKIFFCTCKTVKWYLHNVKLVTHFARYSLLCHWFGWNVWDWQHIFITFCSHGSDQFIWMDSHLYHESWPIWIPRRHLFSWFSGSARIPFFTMNRSRCHFGVTV